MAHPVLQHRHVNFLTSRASPFGLCFHFSFRHNGFLYKTTRISPRVTTQRCRHWQRGMAITNANTNAAMRRTKESNRSKSEGRKWGVGSVVVESAFLGRPDFQSRGPQTLILKGFGAILGPKSGAPQTQIQRPWIQCPILGPLSKVESRNIDSESPSESHPILRSRPPFTGAFRGPGWKVPHGVGSECPKECFSSAL